MTATDGTSGRARRDPRARELDDPSQGAERNRLLRALPAESYERLRPHLEPVALAQAQSLWEPDASIHSVYFPRSCVISVLVLLDEEAPVESATIGREGMLGVPVTLGATSTSTRALAQVPGDAARVPATGFRAMMADDAAFSQLMLRYAQSLLEQTSQSVACNRRHAMEERCARWLLMTQERVGTDSFPLTHDFLAFMLGVRRATVTVAAGMLQQAGLIRYSRGKITVLDRARLEEASCECYRTVKERSDRLLGQDDGREDGKQAAENVR
jgi:CRP-like cAMP-binding protein